MRILLVSDYGTPTGGAEVQLLALRDGLRREGHDARLFTSDARPSGMPASVVEADHTCVGTTGRWRTLLQAANPWAARELSRVLAEFKPDVVHITLFLTQLSPLILPVLARARCPLVLYAVWYRPVCPTGTRLLPDGSACRSSVGKDCWVRGCLPARDAAVLLPQMALWRRLQGIFDRIVADSDALKQVLKENGLPVSDVIWHGVPATAPTFKGAGQAVAAFAGRLVPEKGVHILLEAWERVWPDLPEGATLLVAGDGPERERLRELAGKMGAAGRAVTWLGHIKREELPQQLASAGIHVVPSLWAEPFGIVAAEAMMRGAAVIASDTGGLAEIVRQGETGLLVPRGDPSALADALRSLLTDPARTRRLGAAGRVRAMSELSDDAHRAQFLRLYETVIRGRQRSKARPIDRPSQEETVYER